MNYDTIVVGGGLVGAAVAHGLGRLGEKVLVLDEGDVAFRASRGNFGLVWVQSKTWNTRLNILLSCLAQHVKFW